MSLRWLAILAVLAACEDDSRSKREPERPRAAQSVQLVYEADSTDVRVIDSVVSTLRARLDKLGMEDAMVVRKGLEIVVEIAGSEDEITRTVDHLRRSAVLELTMIDEDSDYMRAVFQHVRNDPEAARFGISGEVDAWQHDQSGKSFNDYYVTGASRAVIEPYLVGLAIPVPDDRRVGYEAISPAMTRTYLLERTTVITGARIDRASVVFDPLTNRPEVMLELDADGARAFAEATDQHQGHKLAIVLDDRVTSAPVIQSRIGGGRISITMGGSDPAVQQRDAEALAAALNAGSLPVPIRQLQSNVIPLP